MVFQDPTFTKFHHPFSKFLSVTVEVRFCKPGTGLISFLLVFRPFASWWENMLESELLFWVIVPCFFYSNCQKMGSHPFFWQTSVANFNLGLRNPGSLFVRYIFTKKWWFATEVIFHLNSLVVISPGLTLLTIMINHYLCAEARTGKAAR
jgi:hypothetical protein